MLGWSAGPHRHGAGGDCSVAGLPFHCIGVVYLLNSRTLLCHRTSSHHVSRQNLCASKTILCARSFRHRAGATFHRSHKATYRASSSLHRVVMILLRDGKAILRASRDKLTQIPTKPPKTASP